MSTVWMITKQRSPIAWNQENFRTRMPTQQTQRERESQAVDDRCCWTNNDSPYPQACSQLEVTYVDLNDRCCCATVARLSSESGEL